MKRLITPPIVAPVSLSLMRKHVREDSGEQDDVAVLYIEAGAASVEEYTGRALASQVWDFWVSGFPASGERGILIPKPPLIEILGVFYRNTAGLEVELAASAYEVDRSGTDARLVAVGSSSWPSTVASGANAVRIRFRAGYVDGSSPELSVVPAPLQQAVLLMAGHFYSNREAVSVGVMAVEMPMTVKWLCDPYVVETRMA